jgi:hypothetical protein
MRHQRRPLTERLWKHIDVRGQDDCWPWTASVDKKGYGQINGGNGRTLKSHRLVLAEKIGRELADGEWSLHTCDVPPCNNPAHLYVGSAVDNVRDMYTRGRARDEGAKGARNGNAKLTDDAVRAIRDVAAVGGFGTKARLAESYGVSQAVISAVVLRRTWRHVT